MSDTCEPSIGHVSGLYTFYDTNLLFYYFIIIIVYTFSETLLDTVCITILFNGNYIILFFYVLGLKKVALLALIVLF